MLEAIALLLFQTGIQITHVKLTQLAYKVPPSTSPPSGNIFIPYRSLQIMDGLHFKRLFKGLVLKISSSHTHDVTKSTHVPRPFHGWL